MASPGQEGRQTSPERYGDSNLSRHQVRVLLAEDHDDTRFALTLLLEMEGYEVYAARDGQEALTIALERQPDIVITDFDMPRMDGAGLSHALRTSSGWSKRVPIVVLTALGWSLVQQAMEAGADLHIAKPVDFDVLGAMLVKLTGDLGSLQEAASGSATGESNSSH